MIKKLKLFLLSLASIGTLLAPALAPAVVYAQDSATKKGLCEGVELQVGADCPTQENSAGKINDVLKLVIDIFSLVVGVVSVIMIIVGGLKYITSGGDSGNVTSAKNTILYAVIGLVVVALAQFIVRFVLVKVNQAGQ